jgi:hypothetical protein
VHARTLCGRPSSSSRASCSYRPPCLQSNKRRVREGSVLASTTMRSSYTVTTPQKHTGGAPQRQDNIRFTHPHTVTGSQGGGGLTGLLSVWSCLRFKKCSTMLVIPVQEHRITSHNILFLLFGFLDPPPCPLAPLPLYFLSHILASSPICILSHILLFSLPL